MFGLFGKAANKKHVRTKPTAVAFVDYEHWYISLDKMYHIRPDVRAWRDDIASKYEIREIVFFADFANPSLRQEIPKIREITNYIIETQNVSSNFKKDFTDFIMLDHIYQRAMKSQDIDTFILFSGDGHFNSVVSFLITQMGKKVGVYGIKDAVSNQLRNSASWYVLLPEQTDPDMQYYGMILKNLKYLKDNATAGRKVRPTFTATCENVSRLNCVPKADIMRALRALIDNGYISQNEEKISARKSVRVLQVDWNKCRDAGMIGV